MAWANDLLRSRVSVPIVLGGAAIVIALIRLSSLLPEQYYFSFSTLIGSDRSPFIVEPPGVTYARLCDIVRKHHLANGTFSVNLEGCARAGDEAKARAEKSWGQTNESALYRAVYANDEAIRQSIEGAARGMTLTPLTPVEIRADMENVQSLADAVAAITRRYHTKAQERFTEIITRQPEKFEGLRSFFQALPPGEPLRPEQPQLVRGIDEKGAAAFIRAVTATNASISAPLGDVRLEPISKSKVDELIRVAFSPETFSEQIIVHYVTQIGDRYSTHLAANLRNEGIDTVRDKSLLDNIIRNDAMGSYLVSAGIRLAPVLLFGLVIGLAFGAREVTSAALAAALAAFLLAWPIVLLWDRVVSYSWQDKRPIFFAFYILYVLSFFVAARFAAGVGAAVRGWLPGSHREQSEETAEATVGVGLLRDFTVGVVVNALFYAGTAMITLFT